MAVAFCFAFASIHIMQTNPKGYGIQGFLVGMAVSVGSFISWIENKIENRIQNSIDIERRTAESQAKEYYEEILRKLDKHEPVNQT